MPRWCGALLSVILAVGLLSPTAGWGQQEAGWTVTPSFALSEVFDDNIFSRNSDSTRQSDLITRLTPGLQAGYYSIPLTLVGRYTFDAEVYARHPELNKAQIRQQASAEVRYLPIRPLTLSMNGSYARTQTPQDLNTLTGIESARSRAESYSVSPSASYQVNSLTTIGSHYSFTRDKRGGGVETDTNAFSIDLQRRIAAQDTGTITYAFRHYQFDQQETSGGNDTTTSHVGSLTWSHTFTPLTSLTLQGGARFSEGTVNPEVSATIQHRLQQGQLSFTYARSQTTAIGLGGTIDTESFSATASYEPIRFLRFSATPAFFRNERQNATSRVYSLGLNASYEISRWLSLVGSYRFSFQDGAFSSTTGGASNQEILRNVALIQLVTSYPYRLD